ncbi:MAG: hypothetical protein OEX97_01325, partial [Acidimicrobiia bacterium]|nr:hypothetical protein [Acidimicrobiia bacterium]
MKPTVHAAGVDAWAPLMPVPCPTTAFHEGRDASALPGRIVRMLLNYQDIIEERPAPSLQKCPA